MNRVCVYMIRSSCDGSVAAATTKIPMWNAFRALMLSCSWRHTTQCPLLSLRLCRYNCACLPVMCCACLLEMILKWPALPCALPVAERALSLRLRSKSVNENVSLASAFYSWSSRKGKQLNQAARLKFLALATAGKP